MEDHAPISFCSRFLEDIPMKGGMIVGGRAKHQVQYVIERS